MNSPHRNRTSCAHCSSAPTSNISRTTWGEGTASFSFGLQGTTIEEAVTELKTALHGLYFGRVSFWFSASSSFDLCIYVLPAAQERLGFTVTQEGTGAVTPFNREAFAARLELTGGQFGDVAVTEVGVSCTVATVDMSLWDALHRIAKLYAATL